MTLCPLYSLADLAISAPDECVPWLVVDDVLHPSAVLLLDLLVTSQLLASA